MTYRKDTGSIILGRYLGAKRLAAGWSYRELAARIGKAPSTIQAWEQGKRMPQLDDLFVLANAFKADLGELVNLAATPAKDLEKRLAAAESRLKKAHRQASLAGDGTNKPGTEQALTTAGRELAFLQNLLAQRKKQERPSGPAAPGLAPLYNLKKIPVLGSITAGRPRLAAEEVSEYTDVPFDLAVDYTLIVEGDSMIGAGIAPGDQVWVKQTTSAAPGETVVALLENGEVTIKHLLRADNYYLLRANNPDHDYPDIPLGPDDRIIGVVQRVIKRPGPPPR